MTTTTNTADLVQAQIETLEAIVACLRDESLDHNHYDCATDLGNVIGLLTVARGDL